MKGFGDMQQRRGNKIKSVLYLIGIKGKEMQIQPGCMMTNVPVPKNSLTKAVVTVNRSCKPSKERNTV